MKGYPRGFVAVLVGAMLLILATGALLTPTTLMMRLEMDLPWRLPYDGRAAVAAAHAIFGVLLLMLSGALWSVHMRAGWRRRRQRISGAALGVLLLVLSLSAVGLYYLGDEMLAMAAAMAHLGLGLVLAVLFGWHWARGKSKRMG